MKKAHNKILKEIFSIVAPGTLLREALTRVMEAKNGALIVIGNDENITKLVDGGFEINSDFTPQKLYELTKMDGAIILDEKISKITHANVQLQPDVSIKTNESGTRHKTAERVAKETGNLVVTISERRTKITVYKDDFKYQIRDTNEILAKASQALKALEKYAIAIENQLDNLTILEFDDIVTINEVAEILQKYAMLFKISDELEDYIIELGIEGRLIYLQYEEATFDLEEEAIELIKDYKMDNVKEMNVFAELRKLSFDDLFELSNISSILGYSKNYSSLDKHITGKGYRVLSEIKRITKKDIENIIEHYEILPNIIKAKSGELSEIKNLSKFKASAVVKGIKRLKSTILLEK